MAVSTSVLAPAATTASRAAAASSTVSWKDRLVPSSGSVRGRIALWISLLTGLALAGSGIAAYVVFMERTEDRIIARVEREIREFQTLKAADRFTTANALMRFSRQRHLPGQNEVIITYVADQGYEWSTGRNLEGLLATADLAPVRGAIEESLPSGGWRSVETGVGTALVAVTPVDGQGADGAYTIAYFVDKERGVYVEAVRTYGAAALIAWLMVTGGAWLIAGRVLRPLRALRATARAISESDLSRRIDQHGHDDLTDLAVTFNEMLNRLEGCVLQQRRFLDDTCHEVLTPATIMLGHLDVLDVENPADVVRTRELLRGQLAKVARIVRDLSMLAKAEHPAFLQPRRCEAAVLTREVLEQAKALGARDWILENRVAGNLWVDPDRITQALIQLLVNAFQHTDDGDTITLRCASEDGTISWWVRDNGAGVDPADQDRVFERFQRGRDAGPDGSGLGLAIVRAIAEAHGGVVRLDPDSARGATFTLVVPREGTAR